MPTIEIRLSGLTTQQTREIAAALSRMREEIPTHNHSGTIAEHWAPIVNVEGPELFGLVTPKVPLSVAAAVLTKLYNVEG